MMDRLLLGDNQFFGINHMSEEKARAQAMRSRDIGAIIDVLDMARRRASAPLCAPPMTGSPRSAITVRANPERYGVSGLLSVHALCA